MPIILRDYQQTLISKCSAEMRAGKKRILVCSPTGSGKTGISAHMLSTSAENGNRCIFLVHRVELLRQTVETFEKFGVKTGIISAGFPETPNLPIQVASIPTVRKRLGKIGDFGVVVCDEAAHAPARSWKEVLDAWPEAWRIGLSATPVRMDGRGFTDLFDTLVQGPSVAELIRDGWLAPFKLYAPPGVDPSSLHVRAGDYVPEEAAALVDHPHITGDVIQHYRRLSDGKRAIVFCTTISHSRNVARQFQAAGIPSIHVDGGTNPEDRERAIEDLRAGRVQVLTNCALFVEGVDVPALETCIILRPTRSLSMWKQMVGRALRPADGKTALILDHVGACAMHGFPDDEPDWSLYGAAKRSKAAACPSVMVRTCSECYACYAPALLRCPFCGEPYTPTAQEIKQREGELAEIQRMQKRREVGMSLTLADFQRIGRERGYAPGWAHIRYKLKQAKTVNL